MVCICFSTLSRFTSSSATCNKRVGISLTQSLVRHTASVCAQTWGTRASHGYNISRICIPSLLVIFAAHAQHTIYLNLYSTKQHCIMLSIHMIAVYCSLTCSTPSSASSLMQERANPKPYRITYTYINLDREAESAVERYVRLPVVSVHRHYTRSRYNVDNLQDHTDNSNPESVTAVASYMCMSCITYAYAYKQSAV